jgi:hypothetical protein
VPRAAVWHLKPRIKKFGPKRSHPSSVRITFLKWKNIALRAQVQYPAAEKD